MGRHLLSGTTTAAVLIWNDVTEDGREAFYAWHDGEHMPERMGIPGFVRGRRYAHPGRSPEWFTVYEASSLDVLVSPAYLERLNNPTAGTRETLKYFRNTARSVCRLQSATGIAAGGYAVVFRADCRDLAAAMPAAEAIAGGAMRELSVLNGVVSTSVYLADLQGSFISTAESSTRQFDVPPLTLVVETSHREAATTVMRGLDAHDWDALGLRPREGAALYQLEVCFG
jgi:hypothetical protein